ncbi:error-prone DNA polymerase [Roseomonas frigidaquae]|uniref:Error-prone DNA polymerase n=1 Tax=Falsiroseomonas frigidaquae TaxID=487318 RepID=A0ABX1EU57_9PROT|nr:error-prone DNA polymerase [Falsiroseomonas frigidaquae]NKE44155.1 error-prone DNA polymerase [Falsiroseomonas frigidaquae]
MTAPPGYAELAARSHFSFLDGASHPAELAQTAAALGLAGLGLCDTNSLAGVVRGHVGAKEAGLRFAVGCRLVLADGSAWLAWPTDRTSYGRLTALLSQGRMTAPKGECWLGRENLFAAAEGLALAAIPPPKPDADFARQWRADAAALRDRLALPLLLAASCPYLGRDQQRLDGLAAIAGDALLATGDIRYHHPGRRRLADVLTAIRLRTTVDALGHDAEPNGERHIKPPAEMARLFARHPQALANTLRVLDATAGFSLDQLRYEYPEEVLEPGRTAQETLKARVAEALAALPYGVSANLRGRIDHELELIGRLGYAPYFLTVHEIVAFAKREKILCQGRGSAANSSVCYVLGITAVDPDKHDLLFERFVSASRGEPPDIDIDFEHERREEVIQHLYHRYGRHRAAICATIIRYRARSAIREVGRAMGLTEDVTARLAKASWGPGREIGLQQLAESEGLDTSDPRLAMTLELAEELQDVPRHAATHVGGFVITRGPLTELAVVTNAAMEDRTVLEWDKDDIEALGILKVDVLGLGMLSCIRRALALLRDHLHRDYSLATLPRECAETYAMLRRADSVGVFQVESRAQMNMLPRLKPKEFYDLVVQVAIVRPGPIQGDMVHPYLRRRQGIEQPEYPSPGPEHPPDELKQVLKKTLGVPLFQEQAMKLAIVAAGFTADEADLLRRSMATFKMTGGVAKYRDKLVQGMVRRGYQQDFAERVFSQIEGFGSYGFPESHAASFAHLVYASSWIKCHHPGVFACALLNSQPMGFYAPAQIVRDAREHGVEVRPVDVNASDWDCTLEPAANGLALRLGLRLVTGLAEAEARAIVAAREARNGAPFTSVEDLAWRSGAGKRALVSLAAADAFAHASINGAGLARRDAAWEARGVPSGPRDLPLFAITQDSVAAALADEAPLLAEPPPLLPPHTEGEAVVGDYLATGLTLRQHPLALLRAALATRGCDDTRRLAAARAGTRLRLPGLVLMRQRPGSAKGVVFLTIEDEFGNANIVVFQDISTRDRAALVAGRLLLVEGVLEREDTHAEVPILHVIARRLVDWSALLDALPQAQGNSAWAERSLGRADEVRRPDPGARAPKRARLPPSRDFR